jgi:hypothetical protein
MIYKKILYLPKKINKISKWNSLSVWTVQDSEGFDRTKFITKQYYKYVCCETSYYECKVSGSSHLK